jgi:sensor histidine kinase YesM
MLRYVLYENTPTVPLSDEFDFVNSYTKLMRMRLGESFPINMQMSNDTPELRVAPLIFISPIENAFKHGNTGQPNAFIDIIITATNGVVKAHIANRFNTATNNNISQVVRHNDDHGIGDANLRRRLELIYGDNASIKSTVDGDIYSVDMTINLITNNPTKTSN